MKQHLFTVNELDDYLDNLHGGAKTKDFREPFYQNDDVYEEFDLNLDENEADITTVDANEINEKLKKKFPYDGTLVEVKPSTIPNAGFGLFSLKMIPKDSFICEYNGKQSKKLNSNNDYTALVQDKNNELVYIDAEDKYCCFGRYINDNVKKKKINARFIWDDNLKKAFIFSTRKIKKGEEIFLSYGKKYWKVKKVYPDSAYTKRLKANRAFTKEKKKESRRRNYTKITKNIKKKKNTF